MEKLAFQRTLTKAQRFFRVKLEQTSSYRAHKNHILRGKPDKASADCQQAHMLPSSQL